MGLPHKVTGGLLYLCPRRGVSALGAQGWFDNCPMVCPFEDCSANPDQFEQLLVEIRLVCGAQMHLPGLYGWVNNGGIGAGVQEGSATG